LTARDQKSEDAIKKYLESIDIDTSKITFVLLGDSSAEMKAAWIADRIEAGATDVLFFDDSGKNVDAVQALTSKYPDVEIKARKVKYAEDIAENTPQQS
jgi:hypothetical protein